MRAIAKILSGSTLYGTTTEDSDVDTKGVFLPEGRSIVLQRPLQTFSTNADKVRHAKNKPGETDHESFSLKKFFDLVNEGQTIAIEMLFAPPSAHVETPAREWSEIVANRPRLLTKKVTAFVSFAKQQAGKYGLKGARLGAIEASVALVEEAIAVHGPGAIVRTIENDIRALMAKVDYVEIVDIPQATGNSLWHWKVCDRHLPFTITLKLAMEILMAVKHAYGSRARIAANNNGRDWKALSHAMKAATEAHELLTTGEIHFPLSNAAHLVEIKTGQIAYEAVQEEIDIAIAQIESDAYRSSLPESVDEAWIEDFLAEAYAGQVLKTFGFLAETIAMQTKNGREFPPARWTGR